MSAPSCLVFFGVRFEVSDDEMELIETRTDQRLRDARAHRLDHYFGKFIVDDVEKHLLFIGKRLANIGFENAMQLTLAPDELQNVMRETARSLEGGGWTNPQLFVQYEPDF